MTDPPKPHRISDITYAIPFGRYVGSNVVSPGADEVLVGREGQRAYFIDLLISSGRQGAYLVTGRRGSGKTSFVKHCIAEYEASVFQRFLRNNVGRGLLDRVLVLICWMLVLLGALLLSEITQLLVPLIRGGGFHRPLLWLILAALGLALLYPVLYARAVLAVVLENTLRAERVEDTRFSEIAATILVSALLIGAWFLMPMGLSPDWTLGAIVGGIGALYLGVQAFSYGDGPRSRWWLTGGYYALGFVAYAVWAARLIDLAGALGPLALALGGSIFVGTGLLLRGIYQHQRMTKIDEPVALAMRRGGHGYRYTGLATLSILAAAPYLLLLRDSWSQEEAETLWRTVEADLAVALVVALLGGVRMRYLRLLASQEHAKQVDEGRPGFPNAWSKRVRKPAFVPRPVAILAAGALFSCVIALQTAHPVLEAFAGIEDPSGLFAAREHEIAWLLLATLCLGLLHFIQYEWALRPFLQPREEQPLDPEEALPWEDRDPIGSGDSSSRSSGLWRRHRELAALTLPWAVYRLWLPTIAVAVNLGLDVKLGAGQIIQAMLAGLREKYHTVFTSWNSGLANLGRFVGLLVILILTTLAGQVWFGLPSTRIISEAESAAVAPPRPFWEDRSACWILAATRDRRSPVLADHLCDLGETWFHFVYFNFVPQPRDLDEEVERRPERLLVPVQAP